MRRQRVLLDTFIQITDLHVDDTVPSDTWVRQDFFTILGSILTKLSADAVMSSSTVQQLKCWVSVAPRCMGV